MRNLDQPSHFREAMRGDLPAEALTPYDRRVLMAALVRRGMTDREIAAHTQWTDYTVARIRDFIGLDPVWRPAQQSYEFDALRTRCVLCDQVTLVTPLSAVHGLCLECNQAAAGSRTTAKARRTALQVSAR